MYNSIMNALKGNGFKVVSLNIRSILKHKDELSLSLNSVDLLCLQETWLNDKVSDNLLFMDGYQLIRQDRGTCMGILNKTKAGGGLLIYTADHLASFLNRIDDCSTCSKNCKQLWLKIAKPSVEYVY